MTLHASVTAMISALMFVHLPWIPCRLIQLLESGMAGGCMITAYPPRPLQELPSVVNQQRRGKAPQVVGDAP